jgi:hypothetical protein
MTWAAFETNNVPLILCGVFYSLLCVFSIVTGLMYMSGKRALNPLELSDSFVKRLQNSGELEAFARRMGLVTFVVGIVQGLTAFACLRCGSVVLYVLAVGFTLFSVCSVLFKLKGKINAFPLLKLTAYLAILVILLLGSTRALFF